MCAVQAQPTSDHSSLTNAQGARKSGSISGKVEEAGSKVLLEYANVAVYSQRDSSLINGSIAGADGRFEVTGIPVGSYYVEIGFLGYNSQTKSNIVISESKLKADLGTIRLEPASENIEEVTVTAQSQAIAYEIDKKVIDPAQFPTAADGTAVDVLANTPSVTVDIEGNVSLRGSSSFTVLVDGRPTPFDAADALQQIPASSIRNIEIITNPSAKFDPDGNAGIININTQKTKMRGFSGIINGMYDTNGSYSGDALLNYRMGRLNFFVNARAADRRRNGTTESNTMTIDTITSYTASNGDQNGGWSPLSVRAGADWYINDFNTLTFNAAYNSRSHYNNSDLDYKEWNSLGDSLETSTDNGSESSGSNMSLSLDYRKTFEKDGQELTAYLRYSQGDDEEFALNNQYGTNNLLQEGLKNWEEGSDMRIRAKVDYVHPFSSKAKLETGFQARVDRSEEWNDVHWYTTEPDNYQPNAESQYYSKIDFNRDIYSLYATFSNSMGRFGYQLGLRSEYTDRNVTYNNSDESYGVNRLDFFPTIHTSFKLPYEQQMIASYTRRIERPRGFELEPFVTYTDAYSVRTGNPAILPQYIDSYELGYQKQITDGFVSGELYFRQTNNKIERVQSVYSQNVMMYSVANVGTDYSLGVELMFNYKPVKWWTFNLMGNIYRYEIDGEYNGLVIDTESNNWSSRFNNTFMLWKNGKLQVDAMYNSPSVTAQGRREGFMMTNLAVRQDFLDNKLGVTISARDVLNTGHFENTSEGENFSSYRKFDMKSPVFSVVLSYRINNYKQKSNSDNSTNSGSDSMDSMDSGSEMGM